MSFKPIIFLAFANDKVDNALYLRNLSIESHGINKALEAAARSGLCEVVEKSSASVDDIVDVFTDPRYESRISIFHYGGHANGFSLLLEASDGSKTLTHKDGLVPFLARQENLKLVFLNGCSSEGQTADLLKAGIPAVIGTTTAINDAIATGLAVRFYGSLADGSGIERAWADATDQVKITSGTSDTRALFWEGKKETTDHFPWVIQFKPGAEMTKAWNLPDISGNPLYGLPPIPATFNLPESPFLYLNRYERRHAEVFFGRSNYIRSLYYSVRDSQAPPIILLYGQSGVGKSSLLEAGLQPRLETAYEILYLRRNGQIGLCNTMYYALLKAAGYPIEFDTMIEDLPNKTDHVIDVLKSLGQDLGEQYKTEIHSLIDKIVSGTTVPETPAGVTPAPPATMTEAWKELEKKLNKPILIILDQVEEAYTRPNEILGNEINALFIELKSLFSHPGNVPQGKIILSFRKEYHPEIEEYCKNYELPRSKVFIEHITKEDVSEVFKGFSESPRLKARYNLTIEDGLPDGISTDVSADKDSPIAPMLQILLTKMWLKAISINPDAPVFSHQIYRDLKEEGLAMDEFLQNQLNFIKKKLPEIYQQGFVLDLLHFHCTPNSTSAARTGKQLMEHYPSATDEASTVLNLCEEYFLITDLGGTEYTAMLAHDTLAKSVTKMQQRSAQPLQQARRVLASRMEAVRGGSEFSTLDEWDLKLIDGVKKFLPALAADELKLIETSHKEILKKQREKKLLSYFKTAIILISIIGALIVVRLWIKSKRLAEDSYINHMAAASAANLNKDPTLALHQAADGLKIKEEKSNAEIKKSLAHAFYSSLNYHTPWYSTLADSGLSYTALIAHQGQKRLIPFSETDSLLILDFEGHIMGSMSTQRTEQDNMREMFKQAIFMQNVFFTKVQWSQDGQHIIALNNEGYLQIHDQNGKILRQIGAAREYNAMDVSPVSNLFIAYSEGGYFEGAKNYLRTFDMNGGLQDSIQVSSKILQISFTPDGQQIVILSMDQALANPFARVPIMSNDSSQVTNQLEVLDLAGHRQVMLDAIPGPISIVKTSTNGSLIAAATPAGILVWDKNGSLIKKIMPAVNMSFPGRLATKSNEVLDMSFQPTDSLIVIGFRGNEARIYNVFNESFPMSLSHQYVVTSTSFSADGLRILTCSGDNTASVWDLHGTELYKLKGHTNDVTDGFFSPDGQQVITTSLDGTVRRWQLNNYQLEVLSGHKGPVNYIDLDPTERYLVSSGADHTMRLWDVKSKKQIDTIDLGAQGAKYATFINEDEVLGINQVNEAYLYRLSDRHLVKFIGHQLSIEWAGVIGDHVITAGKDRRLIFWNKDGKPFKTIDSKNGEFLSLDISQQDSLVAVGSQDGHILLYDYDGNEAGMLSGHSDAVNYIDVSNDGMKMVSASRDRSAIIWDLKTKKEIARLQRILCAPYNDCQVISANFSNNGQMVVTTSSDRTIRIWSISGNLLATLVGHTDAVVDAYFDPNDLMIYSFSSDHTLRLWDLHGKEINAYTGHTAQINSATMDREINHIYSASDDGTIRMWLTPFGVYKWIQDNQLFDKNHDHLN